MEEIYQNIYISDPKIVKENYHKLFIKYIDLMKPNKNPELKLISTNDEILNYKYDNSNFSVTDNDIERTRLVERKPYPDFGFYLKQLLIYYCDMNKIKYKQGMNELMGVFLLMKLGDEKIELYDVYNVFLLFLDLFFCNYYYETNVNAINSSCSLMQLLLRYHDLKYIINLIWHL